MTVVGDFTARGGIRTTVTARYENRRRAGHCRCGLTISRSRCGQRSSSDGTVGCGIRDRPTASPIGEMAMRDRNARSPNRRQTRPARVRAARHPVSRRGIRAMRRTRQGLREVRLIHGRGKGVQRGDRPGGARGAPAGRELLGRARVAPRRHRACSCVLTISGQTSDREP